MFWILLVCLSAPHLWDSCPRLPAVDSRLAASRLPSSWLLASKLTVGWLPASVGIAWLANDVRLLVGWPPSGWLLASKSMAGWLPASAGIAWLANVTSSASRARQPPLESDSMTLRYSISELLRLKSTTSIPGHIISNIKESGLLRRPRYVHRSSRRKFVYSGNSIPSLWTNRHPAPARRHQNNHNVRTACLTPIPKASQPISISNPSHLNFALVNSRSINTK